MAPDQVKQRLTQAYPDGQIEVWDMTGGGDHYQVSVTSSAFKNLSRIKRHQSVMAVFDKELKSGEIHALTIQTNIPAEN